jgi:hypothetical protein
MKNIVKKLLREGLISMMQEKSKNTQPQGDGDSQNVSHDDNPENKGKKTKEQKKKLKKDYSDVKNYFNKDLAYSQVDVMKDALGWEDDEVGTNRSLFGKMVHQEKNEDGGLYQFNNKQIAAIRSTIKSKK